MYFFYLVILTTKCSVHGISVSLIRKMLILVLKLLFLSVKFVSLNFFKKILLRPYPTSRINFNIKIYFLTSFLFMLTKPPLTTVQRY